MIHHAHGLLLRTAWMLAFASLFVFSAAGYAVAQTFSDDSTTQPIRQTNTTNLKVNGLGSEAPASSGNTLQGADGVQQSTQNSSGLQNPGSGQSSLQPNAGQSTFNGGD